MSEPLPIDHVAVPTNDVPRAVAFYRDRFGGEVLYADETWAFIRMGDVKLALVTPTQHPPHVALRVDERQLKEAAESAGEEIESHRDGTRGIYLSDPDGNAVELICYPPGNTHYDDGGDK